MSEKLSCHIVEDLLPLYVDGLTSSQTTEDVKAHLESCESCSGLCASMMAGASGQEQKAQESKKIDYLKKVSKRNKVKILIVICAAVLVIGFGVVRTFMVGKDNRSVVMSALVELNKVTIEADAMNESLTITNVDFTTIDKDGGTTVIVSARTCMAGIFRDRTRTAEFTAKQPIKQVLDINNRVLWESGVVIDEAVGHMYLAKTPYIGNASAVAGVIRSASFPGMDLRLTSGMELQTSKAPYGLLLNITTRINTPGYELLADQSKRYACLLLALVDNMDYVEYTLELENGRTEKLTVTSADALACAKELAAAKSAGNEAAKAVLAAGSIKDFAKSAVALQRLTEVLAK